MLLNVKAFTPSERWHTYLKFIKLFNSTSDSVDEERKTMHWYLALVKIDPNHTNEALQKLKKLPKNPIPGVTMHYSFNVFGTYDAAIWFDAKNQKKAMDFVQKYVRRIPWVNETNTIPTTTIREYRK